MRPSSSVLMLSLIAMAARLHSIGAPEGCKARIRAGHLSQLCQERRKRARQTHQMKVVDGWMDSYDRLTRPALATKMASLGKGEIRDQHVDHENISVGLFVNQVWDIDQRAGSFKVQAQLRLIWQDDRLCFDGSALHHPRINLDQDSMQNLTTGISILESLWLPDVHFHNSIHSGTEEQPDAQLLRVSECGEVLWARRFIVTLWVDFDFARLPFDTQQLKIELESYRMPVDDVILKWTGGCDRSADYTGVANQSNPEWQFADSATTVNDESYSICSTSVNTIIAPGSEEKFSRASLDITVRRQEAMWITGYINPSWTLLLMSYLGLFIGNHNPGRPGVHAITILAHLTIDSSIRAQLPAIADSTWITDFQAGILYFHVAIFMEYCICHYAYRQKKKVKKEKDIGRSCSLLEVELGTISGNRESQVTSDNSGGDSIYSQRGDHDLNQRRAAAYTPPESTPPQASASRMQVATPVYTPGGSLEPRATFTLSDEEDLAGLLGSSPSGGCWRWMAAALDPEKWPRLTALLTEGTAGLTRLDWIARLVMPLLFGVFYMWMYWHRRS